MHDARVHLALTSLEHYRNLKIMFRDLDCHLSHDKDGDISSNEEKLPTES